MKCVFVSLLLVLPLALEGRLINPDYIAKCENGWLQFGQKCYGFFHASVSWHFAESACNYFHAKLAEPLTIEENQFLQGVSLHEGLNLWIGISDIREEGTWIYSSNRQPVQVTYWLPSDPNGGVNQNCVAIYTYLHKDGRWVDEPCESNKYFVCEMPNSDGR